MASSACLSTATIFSTENRLRLTTPPRPTSLAQCAEKLALSSVRIGQCRSEPSAPQRQPQNHSDHRRIATSRSKRRTGSSTPLLNLPFLRAPGDFLVILSTLVSERPQYAGRAGLTSCAGVGAKDPSIPTAQSIPDVPTSAGSAQSNSRSRRCSRSSLSSRHYATRCRLSNRARSCVLGCSAPPARALSCLRCLPR
jgi:hypothetical protein